MLSFSGTVGYELIPLSVNYSQVTLAPPIESTFAPLTIANALLSSTLSRYRLVYVSGGFDDFVSVELGPGADPYLVAFAADSLGRASFWSKLADGWRAGVKWLKDKLGISVGDWAKKGVSWLQEKGFADDDARAVRALPLRRDPQFGMGVGHLPLIPDAARAAGVGRASTATSAEIFDLNQFDLFDQPEEVRGMSRRPVGRMAAAASRQWLPYAGIQRSQPELFGALAPPVW